MYIYRFMRNRVCSNPNKEQILTFYKTVYFIRFFFLIEILRLYEVFTQLFGQEIVASNITQTVTEAKFQSKNKIKVRFIFFFRCRQMEQKKNSIFIHKNNNKQT